MRFSAYHTNMSFRDNLKAELAYQDILVKELADLSGVNKRTLDNYLREKANTPPADVAVKIARALNVSVEYLVTGAESVEQDKPTETVELFSIYADLSLVNRRNLLEIARILHGNNVS